MLLGENYIDGNTGQKILDMSMRVLENGISRIAIDLSPTRVVNSLDISRFSVSTRKYASWLAHKIAMTGL